jgi:predicted DNA-binding transcriptional regulator AlpA
MIIENTVAIDPILSDKQMRAWIGVSSPTLSRWRSTGEGPAFVQLGPRRLGYRKSVVEEWLAARECKSRQERQPEAMLEPSPA